MKIFDYMGKYGYEQLVFCHDKTTGLKAIIAIHDTTLGPALGGTRMWNYDSEDAAIEDVLRLAKGMTYKAAAAGLNLGGGKAVIIGDSKKDKSEEMWRAFGRFVQSLNGRYITAEDVGTTVQDMDYIHLETDHVTGVSASSGSSGNPSPKTAFGVFRGLLATANDVWGSDDISGKVIAVQGVGNVGYYLCKYLHEAGAKLVVCDINQESLDRVVKECGAKVVAPDAIYDVDCDIFAPCALGAVLNDNTIPRLKCKAVAGCANNVLADNRHGDMLHEKGIVYAPDYVINAGGLMNVADELQGYNEDRAMDKIATIYDNIAKVYAISKRDGIPSYKAADRMAEERIEALGRIRGNFIRR